MMPDALKLAGNSSLGMGFIRYNDRRAGYSKLVHVRTYMLDAFVEN